jgi:hypothetical protein
MDKNIHSDSAQYPIALRCSSIWQQIYHANILLNKVLPGYLLVMYFLPSVKDLKEVEGGGRRRERGRHRKEVREIG